MIGKAKLTAMDASSQFRSASRLQLKCWLNFVRGNSERHF
jgi:hypothetical protein